MLQAFVLMNAAAYFCAAAVVVVRSKHFIVNASLLIQGLLFTILGCVLFSASVLNLAPLWIILGCFYVFGGVGSYAGVQDWGSQNHNLFMAAWDLLLAVTCLVLGGIR